MAPRKPNAEQRLAAHWQAVWGTPEGRLAISHLLLEQNLYSPVVSTDPIALAIATGERNVAARIARLIGLKPEAYVEDAHASADLIDKFMRETI